MLCFLRISVLFSSFILFSPLAWVVTFENAYFYSFFFFHSDKKGKFIAFAILLNGNWHSIFYHTRTCPNPLRSSNLDLNFNHKSCTKRDCAMCIQWPGELTNRHSNITSKTMTQKYTVFHWNFTWQTYSTLDKFNCNQFCVCVLCLYIVIVVCKRVSTVTTIYFIRLWSHSKQPPANNKTILRVEIKWNEHNDYYYYDYAICCCNKEQIFIVYSFLSSVGSNKNNTPIRMVDIAFCRNMYDVNAYA